jgi:hypothetical protein
MQETSLKIGRQYRSHPVHSVFKNYHHIFFSFFLQSVFEACEIREIRISEDEAYIGLGGGSGELIFGRISEDMVDNTAYIGLKAIVSSDGLA